MSVLGSLKRRYLLTARFWQKRMLLQRPAPASLDAACWDKSLQSPRDFYCDCFRFFHQRLPAELRAHRAYFDQAGRGFGEDAMHTLWFLLFQEFKPANFLEIGVYRGQVVCLAALLARLAGRTCAVHGISPFCPAGDAVSVYRQDVDYQADTLANFRHFSLPEAKFLTAYSTDPAAVDLIKSRPWDLIYIDGNHDYEIVRQDWEVCSQSVRPGGIIVLDDAGLTTPYRPPIFATGGHPGPSRLASEIDRRRFREIIQVGHNRAFQKM